MRAVRFASRFQLALQPDLCAAARDRDIQRCLLAKISKERILKEFQGCLHGKSCSPAGAITLLMR